MTVMPIVIDALATVTKGLVNIGTRTGRFGNKRRSGDHPGYTSLISARILRRVLET